MTTTTTVTRAAATTAPSLWEAIDPEVLFVNPDAAAARSRRRVKLAAARARQAALAASGEGVFAAGAGGVAGAGISEKELRKQQRMLRNRESAALSRKRKSDRIGELEIQVEALQEENRRLRQRIDGPDGNNNNGGRATAPESPACPPAAVLDATGGAAIGAFSSAPSCRSRIVIPSASTTTVVPATPPADVDKTYTDLGSSYTAGLFSVDPNAVTSAPAVPASAPPATGCTATASALSSASSSFAKACFNIISRPAVFA